MNRHSSIAGLSTEQIQKQLLNVCLYGVREGITIDDSLADNQAKVIEQAGERVGFIVNSANAKVLKDLANKPSSIKPSQTHPRASIAYNPLNGRFCHASQHSTPARSPQTP